MSRFTLSLILGLAFGLAACNPGGTGTAQPNQSVAHWAEKQRILAGDTRNGIVHILLARDGVTQVGYFKPHGRRAVLGIKLDAAQSRVWVLDRDAIYLHDFESRRLLAKLPAPAGLVLEAFEPGTEPVIVAGGFRLRPVGTVLVLIAPAGPAG